MDCRSLLKDVRQANPANARLRPHLQELRKGFSSERPIQVSKLPRKVSKIRNVESVPQTNTGG